MDDEIFRKKCGYLEFFLKHDMFSDICGLYLFSEIKVLREVLPTEIKSPLEVLDFLKQKKIIFFPNAWISY